MRTDTHTNTHESEIRGHPFRVSGIFPSTYHQGSVQICEVMPTSPTSKVFHNGAYLIAINKRSCHNNKDVPKYRSFRVRINSLTANRSRLISVFSITFLLRQMSGLMAVLCSNTWKVLPTCLTCPFCKAAFFSFLIAVQPAFCISVSTLFPTFSTNATNAC